MAELMFIRGVLWLVAVVVPLAAAGCGCYLMLSLPLRRQERARLFLELVEGGLRSGRGPEQTILSAARSGDAALGVKFYLLAAYLEAGRRFGEALNHVTGYLPPRVVALLQVGEEVGDFGKVLAACRRLMPDARSSAQGALSYALVIGLLVLPAAPLVLGALAVFVFPKIRAIHQEFATSPMPGQMMWILDWSGLLIGICGAASLLLYLAMIAYVAGPRLRTWWPALGDRLDWWLPWRRLRMQRDAAGLLGDLLDTGLPEERAVVLAGRGTSNRLMELRAEQAVGDLRAGSGLSSAVRRLDDSGELAWRLENAGNSPGGFRPALAGWVASLDARAFQRQQGWTQVMTTGLVLFNGVVIGLVVTGVFRLLVSIIDEALLW